MSSTPAKGDAMPYVKVKMRRRSVTNDLKEYYSALQEGMQTAVSKEAGVLSLWAVAEKENPTRITIFEIYADLDAYKSHIQTEHFKKYKSTVQNMVKSLELVDVDAIALESKTSL